MPNVGDVLDLGGTNYEILEVLTPGGFGTVYKARLPGLPPRYAAIKVPHPHVLANPVWSKKFEREARILANISHPNVVQVLQFFKTSREMFLVQEWATDANELSTVFPAMPDPERLSATLQIAFALRATHGVSEEARAIHRDLSPRNILINATGTVKVIDFGLAKEHPRTTTVLTVVGDTFGTPGCMAPEQLGAAADVDHRADFYALGRTLAAGIQNRRPEHADVSILPPHWKALCEKLTKYDASDRHTSADDVISDALNQFTAVGIFSANMAALQREFSRWPTPPAAWGVARASYLAGKPSLDISDLLLAYEIPRAELADPSLQVDQLFTRLDREAIEPKFAGGGASFEACDPLGDYLEKFYGALTSQAAKERCFRRMVATAVLYNRYSVMYNIRNVFHGEGDVLVKAVLRRVIQEEDPLGVIHGLD